MGKAVTCFGMVNFFCFFMSDKVVKWTHKSIAVHNMNERASDPAVIHAELLEVRKKYGEITPENALEFAKDKRTALHTLLDWNDAQAGHKFRLLQLRYIIQNVEVRTVSDGQQRSISVAAIHTQRESAQTEKQLTVPDEPTSLSEWALNKLDIVRERLIDSGSFDNAVLLINDAIAAINSEKANGNTTSARERLNNIIAGKKFYSVIGKVVKPKKWKMDGDRILMECDVRGGGIKIVPLEIDEIDEVFNIKTVVA